MKWVALASVENIDENVCKLNSDNAKKQNNYSTVSVQNVQEEHWLFT